MKNTRQPIAEKLRTLTCALLVPVSFASYAHGWQDGSPPAQEDPAQEEAVLATSHPTALKMGAHAPSFSVPTLDDGDWSLAEMAGKAVILEWIDPDCPMVMRQHSPEGSLRLLQLICEGRDDVAWIAINSSHSSVPQSDEAATRAAKEKFLIDYPVGLDPTGWLGRAYGAKMATHVVLIDPSGNVAYMGAPDDGKETQLLSLALAHVTNGEPFDSAPVPASGCEIRYPEGVVLGAALPPMVFKTMDGTTLNPYQFLGSPLVIEWFNPHCPVIQAAHGEGGALADAPDEWTSAGAKWMFVNSAPIGNATTGEENSKKLAEWGHEDLPVALDSEGKLMEAFGATATPHLFVIDERGVLVYAGGHTDQTNQKDRPLDRLLEAYQEGELKVQDSSPNAFGCSIKRE